MGHDPEPRGTLSMWGKRKSRPECTPLPRPMEESTPRPTHHTTYCSHSSASPTRYWCCPACRAGHVGFAWPVLACPWLALLPVN